MDVARVEAVNVVHRMRPGYFHDTAIDKRPLDGPVEVTANGLDGDRQIDSSHGGPDRAVYAYSGEDAEWWTAALGVPIPPGTFGENLRTRGLDVTGALVGERWRIGGVLLEVRMPRTPCHNLSLRMGIERFHVTFNRTGRVGAMLKVLEPGRLEAGNRITVVDRPSHDVTIGALTGRPDVDRMRRLLDSQVPLAAKVRARAQRSVAHA
ncbi:MAG: MOSC domain-containing protein [Nocardioidaceae bacterium]